MLLQAHQPTWAHDFLVLAGVLGPALQGLDVTLEHVGSTAVPGLAAKPIIDLDLAYEPGVALATVTAALAPLGYAHVGDQGIAGREVFKRQGLGPPHPVLDRIAHHLYACPAHGEEYRRHVLFRDFLRHDAVARQRYQDLKMRLAAAAGQDRKHYAALKEQHAKYFVGAALEQAARTA